MGAMEGYTCMPMFTIGYPHMPILLCIGLLHLRSLRSHSPMLPCASFAQKSLTGNCYKVCSLTWLNTYLDDDWLIITYHSFDWLLFSGQAVVYSCCWAHNFPPEPSPTTVIYLFIYLFREVFWKCTNNKTQSIIGDAGISKSLVNCGIDFSQFTGRLLRVSFHWSEYTKGQDVSAQWTAAGLEAITH